MIEAFLRFSWWLDYKTILDKSKDDFTQDLGRSTVPLGLFVELGTQLSADANRYVG